MIVVREIIELIRTIFIWWVIVVPWEAGVRVRFGRWVRVLGPGPHLRLPFVDRVFVQSTRLRYTDLPVQTITTLDGSTVTVSGTVGFLVSDIRILYETLHHASDTIMNLAMAAVAESVRSRRLDQCKPAEIESEVTGKIDLSKFGLGDARFSLIDFAVVRAIRLINGQKWSHGDELRTYDNPPDH